MACRTTQTVVSFSSPFLLPGFDGPQPAGSYRVDHDEESIEGVSWLAWRRVGSFIHLPGIGVRAATHEMAPINPADLDAALERDEKSKGPQNHDRYRLSSTSGPSNPPRNRYASLHGRAGCPADERLQGTLPLRGDLPHYGHASADGKFTAIPHPKRRRAL